MQANPRPLTRVGVYRRSVRASLERVWENVLDWEHLPWLHGESFRAVHCEDSGPWGWRARLATGSEELLVELRVDRDARRYVARTLEGTGKDSEIWTQLDVAGPRCTRIEVEFFVPGVAADRSDELGRRYTQLYQRLWDEDEAMMLHRSEQLERGPAAVKRSGESLVLGRRAQLRERLPLVVDFDGGRYRVLELDGEWLAHAVVCPHRLGPLEGAEVRDGCLVCPWHGYRFDPRSGRSADGRGLRLPPAPRVRVDPGSDEVSLAW